MLAKKDKVGNVPNLRFPEFEGEWKLIKLGNLSQLITKGTTPQKFVNQGVKFVKIECIGDDQINASKCLFIEENVHNKELKRSILKENDLIFAIAGATIGKVNIVSKEILPANTNQALSIIRLKEEENVEFVYQILKSDIMKRYIKDNISVGAQPNLNLEQMNNFSFFQPTDLEQRKLSTLLTVIDKRIQTQSKIIRELKSLKIRLRKMLFGDLFNKEFKTIPIEEILRYEQPNKYIVSNSEYSKDQSLLPVLTANKGFILGYTHEKNGIYDKGDCIIFDDFTMDLKYVDFPFKIKSSAIKILTAKTGYDLAFAFEYLSLLNLQSSEHKRHYLSEVSLMPVPIPELAKQRNISRILSIIDKKIACEEKIGSQLNEQKNFLLKNLFI